MIYINLTLTPDSGRRRLGDTGKSFGGLMDDSESFFENLRDNGEFMESAELIHQRVTDLLSYFVEVMSVQMVDGKYTFSATGDEMASILMELEEEFGSSYLHREQVIHWMAAGIVSSVSSHRDAMCDKFVEDSVESANSTDVAEDGLTIEILWGEMFPDLPNSFGPVLTLAKVALVAVLQGHMWEDPDWDFVYISLSDTLPEVFECYYGAIGLVCLFMYYCIVGEGIMPEIVIST